LKILWGLGQLIIQFSKIMGDIIMEGGVAWLCRILGGA
jgi:hypothetical protein